MDLDCVKFLKAEEVGFMDNLNVNPEVIIVDDSDDLRDLLIAVLRLYLGIHCKGFLSLDDLSKHSEEVLGTKLIILDLNLGDMIPNGMDVYHWLTAQNYAGSVIFLTGHAWNHPLAVQAVATGRPLLTKPVNTDVLVSLIRETIGADLV